MRLGATWVAVMLVVAGQAWGDEPGRVRVRAGLGPALQVLGSFATSQWGGGVSLGAPVLLSNNGWSRLSLDLQTTLSVSGDADGPATLLAAGAGLGVELPLRPSLALQFSLGGGVGALVRSSATMGVDVMATLGVAGALKDSLWLRLEVRDDTVLLITPNGVRSAITLLALVGVEVR